MAIVRPIYQHPGMEPATDASYRTLAYLGDIPTEKVKGIGAVTMGKLAEAGVHSVAHLLMIPPRRYLDRSQMAAIGSAPLGEEITIAGTVAAYSRRRISRGRVMVEARVSDGTGSVRCVWFNPYIRLVDGEEIALSGKLEDFRGSLQMKGPDIDRLDRDGHQTTGRVVPIYPKVANLKHYEVARAIDNALRRSVPIADIVPVGVLDARNLVDRTFAFSNIHAPSSLDDVVPARRRLVFDEFLRIQMALRVRAHDDFESRAGVSNSVRGTLLHRYLAALPFTLTQDQETALEAIMDDMAAPTPLHRLLQGEVGSGKTVVVIAAMLTSVESGHQAAVMAPTEVLATQHYLGTERSLLEAGLAPSEFTADAMGTVSLFEDPDAPDRPVRIGLFTSARVTCNFTHGDVSREQGLSWLADGTIDIAFGTQALIQPDVDFHSLGITVVDEQHRFGVEQRVILRDRDLGPGVPDLLLMTATPIPRTFVMALYGDLEVSTIRTLPPGRMPTRTDAVALVGGLCCHCIDLLTAGCVVIAPAIVTLASVAFRCLIFLLLSTCCVGYIAFSTCFRLGPAIAVAIPVSVAIAVAVLAAFAAFSTFATIVALPLTLAILSLGLLGVAGRGGLGRLGLRGRLTTYKSAPDSRQKTRLGLRRLGLPGFLLLLGLL